MSNVHSAKHSPHSGRYYKKHQKQQKGGTMAYAIGTRFLISSYELIDSGVVNLFSDEFEIDVLNLRLLFRFKKDKKKKEGDFIINRQESSVLVFDIYNSSNPLSQGCFEPLEIGSINERRLYLSFTVHTTSERVNARVFTYNLYMDKKDNER